jgi:hypothetical protein
MRIIKYHVPLKATELAEMRDHDNRAFTMFERGIVAGAVRHRRALLRQVDHLQELLAQCKPYLERGHDAAADKLMQEIEAASPERQPEQSPVGGEQSRLVNALHTRGR